MLHDITSGEITCQMVMIEDGVHQSGENLLQAFLHNVSPRHLQAHILCFENPVAKWKNMFERNINTHDCFSDHGNWNNDTKKDTSIQSIYRSKGLYEAVRQLVKSKELPSIVCIDSLTPVLFNWGLSKCYSDLHSLLEWSKTEGEIIQLICMVHADAIVDKWSTLSHLRHLATAVLQVEPGVASHSPRSALVHITHKNTGGKIIEQVEEYCVNDDYTVSSRKSGSAAQTTETDDHSVDVQHLTTFKLKLNSLEEGFRRQLVLPYIRQHEPHMTGGGKVFYHPDNADDWDDEDPDDDLDV